MSTDAYLENWNPYCLRSNDCNLLWILLNTLFLKCLPLSNLVVVWFLHANTAKIWSCLLRTGCVPWRAISHVQCCCLRNVAIAIWLGIQSSLALNLPLKTLNQRRDCPHRSPFRFATRKRILFQTLDFISCMTPIRKMNVAFIPSTMKMKIKIRNLPGRKLCNDLNCRCNCQRHAAPISRLPMFATPVQFRLRLLLLRSNINRLKLAIMPNLQVSVGRKWAIPTQITNNTNTRNWTSNTNTIKRT